MLGRIFGAILGNKLASSNNKGTGALIGAAIPFIARRGLGPLGLALGGLAVGFVVGTLLPQTQVENERMGETSDRMIDAAKETAGEAVERGKQVAQEAAGAAVDTAKESGREQGEDLTSTLKERTQEQSANV